MTALEIFWQQIDDARQTGADTDLIFNRYIRARSSEPKQRLRKMPTYNFGPRREFTELRPRHLTMIEELGVRDHYDRKETHAWLMDNYYRLFGPLRRSKAKEVPSDQWRKDSMIHRLCNLIELRREEIAAGGRTNFQTNHFAAATGGSNPGARTPARSLTRLLAREFSKEITEHHRRN